MMKVTKKMVALTALVAAFSIGMQKSEACTRAVYIGPENMVVTGRTIDAVVAGNDQMAIGAINYLKQQQIRIPEDIAVVGL